MRRLTILSAVVAALLLTRSYAQSNNGTSIEKLEQQRVELLRERVVMLQQYFEAQLVDSTDVARSQMDLIDVQLDYASSNDEKKRLLTELLGKYDKLIEAAELQSKAPRLPGSPGGTRANALATTEALSLKAERIRIQIMLESL